jgi:glycerol-3-phosphate dehydrogenase
MKSRFDVVVVGAGVVGCAVARELSKYELNVALIEKESDVCGGASKANSGVVHSGVYSAPGSMKAQLCIQGNEMFPKWTEEMGVEFKRIGKLVVARNEGEVKELEQLKAVGEQNQVHGLRKVEKKELKVLEPNISGLKALSVPTAGIVSPYHLTIALAEIAHANGVDIVLKARVSDISQKKGSFRISTSKGKFTADFVVNCAGLHCDDIAGMLGIEKYRVFPSMGEYLVLDKAYGPLLKHLVYPVPENRSGGLGIHLTPTLEGNILLGPSAGYMDDREDTGTTGEKRDKLLSDARVFLPDLKREWVIHSYAGVRCKLVGSRSKKPGDFVIEEDNDVLGFINLMGIESPGLSASPAIAELVVNMIRESRDLKPKKNYNARVKTKRFARLDIKGKDRLISEEPKHGHLICRCEHVTEQEIMEALKNPLGVRTLAGIKYRSRAMMGRCQGGFCRARIVGIMEDSCNMNIKDITQRGVESHLFVGKTKDLRKHGEREC